MKKLTFLLIMALFIICGNSINYSGCFVANAGGLSLPMPYPTLFSGANTNNIPAPVNFVKSDSNPSTKLQALGPDALAISKDGKYAYVGFVLSDTIIKLDLETFNILTVADLYQYFPLECNFIILDNTDSKLFIYSQSWHKLIVLDTQTLSVIHTIDNIKVTGMFRSQDGRLVFWEGNNVYFLNTETYTITEFNDPNVGFLKLVESPSDPSKWYIGTQLGPGASWTIGLYDYNTMTWIHSVTIPSTGIQGIWDLKVIPNEQKIYAAMIGGFNLNGSTYGWVYSIDLSNWQVKNIISIDGAPMCLEVSPDSNSVYVAAAIPQRPTLNNLIVLDTQSDNKNGSIDLGLSIYGWPHTYIQGLKVDPTNHDLLYIISLDANSFTKVNLSNLTIMGEIVFNKEIFRPHFFSRIPKSSSGYVLINKSSGAYYGFELNVNNYSTIKPVRFPTIRTDNFASDIVVDDNGKMLIAQGESFLEVDASSMNIIANHPLPFQSPPSIWNFILSNDQRSIYSVACKTNDFPPNVFLAINRENWQLQSRVDLDGGAFNRPFELPGGSKLYILGGYQNGAITIHILNKSDFTIKKTITYQDPTIVEGISGGPYYPYEYDSNSRTLFLGAENVVLAVDTDNDIIKKVIYLRDITSANNLAEITYVNAMGVIYQPQENYLYLAHLDRSFMSIYDLNNNRFLSKIIPLKGFFPNYAFADDSRSKIYIIDIRSDSISVIDVASKTLEKVIDLHDYLQINYIYLPLILNLT